MSSLWVDPTSFVAVSWYEPASCPFTSEIIMVNDELSPLTLEYFSSLFEVSIFSPFLVQKISLVALKWSYGKTFPVNSKERLSMQVSWLVKIFGGPAMMHNYIRIVLKIQFRDELFINKILIYILIETLVCANIRSIAPLTTLKQEFNSIILLLQFSTTH